MNAFFKLTKEYFVISKTQLLNEARVKNTDSLIELIYAVSRAEMYLKTEPLIQYAGYCTFLEKYLPAAKALYEKYQETNKEALVKSTTEKACENLLGLATKLENITAADTFKKDVLRAFEHTELVCKSIPTYNTRNVLVFEKQTISFEMISSIAEALLLTVVKAGYEKWPLQVNLASNQLLQVKAPADFTAVQTQLLADFICKQIHSKAKKYQITKEENTLALFKFTRCHYPMDDLHAAVRGAEWWEKLHNIKDGLIRLLIMLHTISDKSKNNIPYSGLVLTVMPESLTSSILKTEVLSNLVLLGNKEVYPGKITENDKEVIKMLFETNTDLFKNNTKNLLKAAKALN